MNSFCRQAMMVELRPKVRGLGESCVWNVRGLGGRNGSACGGLAGLGGLAQVFSAELAMHAPGVDAEEERTEEDQTEE